MTETKELIEKLKKCSVEAQDAIRKGGFLTVGPKDIQAIVDLCEHATRYEAALEEIAMPSPQPNNLNPLVQELRSMAREALKPGWKKEHAV